MPAGGAPILLDEQRLPVAGRPHLMREDNGMTQGDRMTGNVLDVAHLAKRYGSLTAVRDLTFTVEPGEVLGFLGPNGAGKTSTLRMILGILKPDAGTIRLFGQPWSMQMQPRIGYLPEERGLYRGMKAADAVAYFARL